MCKPLAKELCTECYKPINTGQSVIECEFCGLIFHSKCINYSENESWACSCCQPKVIPKYNPFKNWAEAKSDSASDADCGQDAIEIGKILENCDSHTMAELNKKIESSYLLEELIHDNIFSSLFFNIDGNFTNFNHFLAILKGIKHDFGVIGLAETNNGPDTSSLYTIPNYTAFYQHVREDKKSGTGVALYVHNRFNATIINEVSHCSNDLESIVVKITNLDTPLYIGAVYRPNDGNKEQFHEQLQHILDFLPNKGTYIMGDFNINLLKNTPDSNFEECIFSSGFSPLISIATHLKPNTKSSCIDNIMCNETSNVLISGTVLDNISHHLPIFQFSKLNCPPVTKEKHKVYYEFSNSNIDSFVNDLETQLANIVPTSDFTAFTENFNSTLNKHCRLSKPKITRSTTENNPWITQGIIDAIQRKHELKKIWDKTVSKDKPHGNPKHHENFKTYRKNLTRIIDKAKINFISKKFSECQDDRKKTWKIINNLRGNAKKTLKPSFIVDKKKSN